jgi:hypothetical protein
MNCNRPFYARIHTGPKQIYLGSYDTIEEAATAYNIAASELYGEYAKLNDLGTDPKIVTSLRDDILARISDLEKPGIRP